MDVTEFKEIIEKEKNINEDFLMIFANTLSKVQKQQIKALNTKDMQVVTS